MRVKEISVYKVHLPFRKPFGHSLALRNNSESIMVKAVSDTGLEGYGEGLPRSYVTGESQDTVIQKISDEYIDLFVAQQYKHTRHVLDTFNGHSPVREKESGVFPGAALCAVEGALLDLYARAEKKPLCKIIGSDSKRDVYYSAVLSTGSFFHSMKMLLKIRAYGFRNIKVKVTGPSDIQIVKIARMLMGKVCSIRADANLAWDFDEALRYIGEMSASGLESIEEPLKDNSPENVVSIQEQTGTPVIVDEGLCSYEDGLNLVQKGFKGIFNIRLSKCGGIAQALKLVQLANENGIRYQLGCQVGESAILSALGRHFAIVHPLLLYLEGSYGTHILKEDISEEDIRFGYRGRGVPLEKEGLGVSVIESRMEEFGKKVLTRTLI